MQDERLCERRDPEKDALEPQAEVLFLAYTWLSLHPQHAPLRQVWRNGSVFKITYYSC